MMNQIELSYWHLNSMSEKKGFEWCLSIPVMNHLDQTHREECLTPHEIYIFYLSCDYFMNYYTDNKTYQPVYYGMSAIVYSSESTREDFFSYKYKRLEDK